MTEHRQVVVEIDDRIEGLIREINAAPAGKGQDTTIEQIRDVVIDAVLGPFGLSRVMLQDVDGGNITTLHNFENGVVANESDRNRHATWEDAKNAPFDRSDYERELPKERKQAFKADGLIIDDYTGRELPRDGRAHRDHVISAREIATSAKGNLAQNHEERVRTANLDENKVWTLDRLNCSKADSDLTAWAMRPNAQDPSRTNAEFYGVNEQRLVEAYERAQEAVGGVQDRALLRKQAREFIREGGLEAGKLALRQFVGLFLTDVATGVVQDIRTLCRDGYRDVSQLAELLEARAKTTLEKTQAKWAEYLKGGLAAGLSGLLSSLATLLINSLITTAKNIVTILREGTVAVLRAVKTIVAPPPGATGADIAREVLRLLSGAVVVAIGISLEESIRNAITTLAPFLAPVADAIAIALTGMVTGVGALLVVLAFDRVNEWVAYRNKEMADVHRGQQVTLLQIGRTAIAIREAAVFQAETARRLHEQFRADKASREEAGRVTDAAIDDYAGSVSNLSLLLGKV
jgi:hypothetical protein